MTIYLLHIYCVFIDISKPGRHRLPNVNLTTTKIDSINDVVASASLGGGSAIRSSENQSGGTFAQTKLSPIAESKHETMTFSQSVDALDVSIAETTDPTYGDGGSSNEASLGEFLARPVQLNLGTPFKALQWTVGAGIIGASLGVIDPWTLWQADPKVKQKLSNFAYLKGTLKVRFIVAGTPFHYGRIQVTYVPFAASNTILAQLISHVSGQPEAAMMYLSTGMKTEIDPMSSTPVEMTLPFAHYKNWMDISVPETLGSLYLRELVPLTQASDTAVSVIAITAFVWMEKAELCVPTLAVPTSKREQTGQPSISGMASAVASAAGKFSSVPVIGRYAKATSIASGAASDVAKLFGLSRPVDITKPDQNKFITSSNMAATQGDSLSVKLTLDPQQEITVDPSTLGLPAKDEMTFESIVNRECWLTTVIWTDTGGPFTVSGASTGANIGALLFVANVTPNLCKRVIDLPTSGLGPLVRVEVVVPTPSMFICRPFNFWRGTMVFRFRVIASSFHRGNLRVSYDPISPVQALDTNSQMTHVLDISQGRELIVRIPWCSQFPYLEVANQLHVPLENYSPALYTSNTNYAYTNYNKSYHNGVLMASIVNTLVAPNVKPAYVVVSSWCEDCEFQSPSQRIEKDYPLIADPTSGADGNDITLVSGKQSSSMSQVCFGERVTSIKSMLKRQTYCGTLNINTSASALPGRSSFVLPQFPQVGYADQNNDDQRFPLNYLTYYSCAFAMRRGGVRYWITWDDTSVAAIVGSTSSAPVMASYTRSWDAVSPGTAGSVNDYYTFDQVRAVMAVSNRSYNNFKWSQGYEGTYLANYGTQERAHEVEVPYYGGTRFSLAQYVPVITAVLAGKNYSLSKNPAELGFQVWVGNLTGRGMNAFAPFMYVSGAEDLAFFWFQAAPPLYIQQNT